MNYSVGSKFTSITNQTVCDIHFVATRDNKIEIYAKDDIKCEIKNEELILMSRHNISINGNSFYCSGSNNNVSIINGVVYSNGVQQIQSKEKDVSYSKKWIINGIPSTKYIHLQGCGDMTLCPDMLNADHLCFILMGSGNIRVPETSIVRGKAKLSGSGNIKFDHTHFIQFDADLTGSGNIYGFIVDQELDCNLTGSGNIKGYAMKGCAIEKHVTGSGAIKIEPFPKDKF